jgi:chromosome segregation ATPase
VAELVNTVIDAAGRMLETVHGVAYANEHAPRVAEIEAELKAERVKVYDLGVANRQLIEERDAARRDRASFAESAQHHIDELRDEIKARAAQYAADADMYSKAIDEKHARIRELEGREGDLRRELANLELALAEARGDVEA